MTESYYRTSCLAGHDRVLDGYDKYGAALWHCSRCGAGVRLPPPHPAAVISEALSDPTPSESMVTVEEGERAPEWPRRIQIHKPQVNWSLISSLAIGAAVWVVAIAGVLTLVKGCK